MVPFNWAIAIAYFTVIGSFCSGQQQQSHIRENDLVTLPEPRAYVPDAGLLDFVYHNHDDMTRFLR